MSNTRIHDINMYGILSTILSLERTRRWEGGERADDTVSVIGSPQLAYAGGMKIL